MVSSTIHVIYPDGTLHDIILTTYPAVGEVSRLWVIGPGEDGAICDTADPTNTQALTQELSGGIFSTPESVKTVKTRMPNTSIHVFLTDRYCTPVEAPVGGIAFEASSDSELLTFGGGRTFIQGVISEGHNAAILDVSIAGDGTIYVTGSGVAPDAINITPENIQTEVRIGVAPGEVMESSYAHWYVWLERNGVQYVPPNPIPIYLTTNNPILGSFDISTVDRQSILFHTITPYQDYIVRGTAAGKIYTGTPASIGDVRLLASNRDVTVTAHVPGYGTASTTFSVGVASSPAADVVIEGGLIQDCMENSENVGFYDSQCVDMWERLLVASHFFDIQTIEGEYITTPEQATEVLSQLGLGGQVEGEALFDLASRLNDYQFRGLYEGADLGNGLSEELDVLLGRYLGTDVIVGLPTEAEIGSAAASITEKLKRMPDSIPPNSLRIDSFPTERGQHDIIISTWYSGSEGTFPTYMPDGVITLSSDWGLAHDASVITFGSTERVDAPGTRPSNIAIPIQVRESGQITASLGGVGSTTTRVEALDLASGTKRLHINTLPGSGIRDTIAFVSVLDSAGYVIPHDGIIQITGGQGAEDVELSEWRGGGGIIRGTITGVGEIQIHAPGLGAGTAYTTPIRHETMISVWHPDTVHVSERFPVVIHAVDADDMPVREITTFDISGGDISSSDGGVVLDSAGDIPLIIQHGNIFHSSTISGFLNEPDAEVFSRFTGVVQLNDTITIDVDPGSLPNPQIEVVSRGLLFSGEGNTYSADMSNVGDYDINVSMYSPGWHPFEELIYVEVSHIIDVYFTAETDSGVYPVARLTICGDPLDSNTIYRTPYKTCVVTAEESVMIDSVEYRLRNIIIDGESYSNGVSYAFNKATEVSAYYVGVVRASVMAEYPDGEEEELLFGTYGLEEYVRVDTPPRYQLWGLIWEKPVSFNGIPGGVMQEGYIEWYAAQDVNGTITYETDMTYLLLLGAGLLAIPILFLLRNKIKFVRFK